jgi:hypothetical protein
MSEVWVVTSNVDGVDRPVGVMSTEAKADAFVKAGRPSEGRDHIFFHTDNVVGLDAQTPGVEEPSAPHYDLTSELARLREVRDRLLGKKSFRSKLLQK